MHVVHYYVKLHSEKPVSTSSDNNSCRARWLILVPYHRTNDFIYQKYKTSCCSTDSKRPHCCCHQLNNYARNSLYFIMRWDIPPKLPHTLGDPGACLIHGFMAPPESTTHRSPVGSSIFVWLAPVTNRQTDTQALLICSNKLHLVLVLRCILMEKWQNNKYNKFKYLQTLEMSLLSSSAAVVAERSQLLA